MKLMLDPQLPDHWKVKKLGELLYGARKGFESSRWPAALGHLVALWCRVISRQEDGVLREWPGEAIAEAGLWPGEPRTFIKALEKLNLLDREELGLAVHQWIEHQGDIIAQRAAERERKRREREEAKKARQLSARTGAVVRPESARSPAPPFPSLPGPSLPSPSGGEGEPVRTDNPPPTPPSASPLKTSDPDADAPAAIADYLREHHVKATAEQLVNLPRSWVAAVGAEQAAARLRGSAIDGLDVFLIDRELFATRKLHKRPAAPPANGTTKPPIDGEVLHGPLVDVFRQIDLLTPAQAKAQLVSPFFKSDDPVIRAALERKADEVTP